MAEFDDTVTERIRAAAEAAERAPLGFSLKEVLAEGSARRHRQRPWARRLGVVLVAAAILVVFFVPLPRLSLFRRLVSSPRLGTTGGGTTFSIGNRLAQLRGSDTVMGDYFGSAVAIAGDTAVVGAFDHDDDAGRVYVFSKTAGGWEQTAELKGSDTVANDNFGIAVGISGKTIVVGAASHGSSSAGRAYVFTRSVSGWKQVAELSSPGTRPNMDHVSVAISNRTIVVGWTYSEPLPGVACVYTEVASGWRQTALLKRADITSFGYSVAVSGTTIVVGSIAAPPAQPVGRAYVYDKMARGWRRSAVLNSPEASNDFSFGFSTAISASTVLVGSDGTGPVYVFTKTAAGWTHEADLRGSDTASGDGFGSALAISGATAVVGAPDAAANLGKAYLFKATATGWRQTGEAKGIVAQGYFGYSVAISGETAVVGLAPTSGASSVHVGRPVSIGRAYVLRA